MTQVQRHERRRINGSDWKKAANGQIQVEIPPQVVFPLSGAKENSEGGFRNVYRFAASVRFTKDKSVKNLALQNAH